MQPSRYEDRGGRSLQIVLASTSGVGAIAEVLDFWLRTLDIEARIRVTPPTSLIVQLLHSNSELSSNTDGINVLILDDASDMPADIQQTEAGKSLGEETLDAIDITVQSSEASWIIVRCRSTTDGRGKANGPESAPRVDELARTRLQQHPHVHLVDVECETYVLRTTPDPGASVGLERYYSRESYASIATAVARTIHAIVSTPWKLIVLDCDNTLWNGICGEVGPANVTIDVQRQRVQRFFQERAQSGFLLSLCSKNDERDVWEVFDKHKDMILTRNDMAAWRVNWRDKSANIQEIADELCAALSSVIFVDDDVAECAAVRSVLPDVLTIQIPSDSSATLRTLDNVWAFDRLRTTEEDRTRAREYSLRRARDTLRTPSMTAEEFARVLSVRVTITPASLSDLGRIAQLSQRTTQFNCSLRRRSEREMRRLYERDGYSLFVVRAGDRYGDYGIVGALIVERSHPDLYVDSFFVSCRVLGRSVEDRMLQVCEGLARDGQYDVVRILVANGPRNVVAREFLQRLGYGEFVSGPGGGTYIIGMSTRR